MEGQCNVGTPQAWQLVSLVVNVLLGICICNSMVCCVINSTSNAEIIVQGEAEYNLLHYECY